MPDRLSSGGRGSSHGSPPTASLSSSTYSDLIIALIYPPTRETFVILFVAAALLYLLLSALLAMLRGAAGVLWRATKFAVLVAGVAFIAGSVMDWKWRSGQDLSR
ncbi:hypothetical protein HDU86_005694 [Geranomyces michiganensis]|nr:hypothetical protein HDU86_005694 [Geranomyces michiganensis]